MNQFRLLCIVKLWIVFIICVVNSAPAVDTIWHNHKGLIPSGLYSPADHVVILDSTNIEDVIYGRKNAWVIEFYANWCPHCQRFSAIWKTLSHSIDNWKDIVNVGVLDCATIKNTPICHEFEVSSVPAIKYFSPYSQRNTTHYDVKKSEIVEVLREKIIDMLMSDHTIGNNLSWPNLLELEDLKSKDVFNGIPMDIKYYFIIFEEDDSYLGMTTILDFHSVPQILIRRVSANNRQLCDAFKVNGFPTVIAIDRENSISNLTLSRPSRTAVYTAIKNYLILKGIELDATDIIDDSSIMKKYLPKRNANRNITKLKDDNVYQVDLEAALRYSLEQEIPLSNNISDNKMIALKNYLQILADYFPIKFGRLDYLKNIYNEIKNKTTIDGQEFYKLVTGKKINAQFPKLEWLGCNSSFAHLRRYTCGLWTLFHTLTVKYAIAADENHTGTDVGEKVLLVMYDYAKYFFGCSHCAEHFVHMARKLNIDEPKTADQAVLWLWKAHNEVNSRLAGDVTEDPEYPKIQYPAKVHCSTCRYANNTWNESEVLHYLKGKYGGSPFKYNLPG